MGIIFEGETNIGRKRKVNEDSLWPKHSGLHHYANRPHGQLFIVADGLGGHGAGNVASELAVKVISETYYTPDDDTPEVETRLRRAIYQAHQQIVQHAAQSPETKDMGTTVIADGLSNKEISSQLNIAVHTVKSHVHNILEKLALQTRLEIATYAHRTHKPDQKRP